MLLLVALAHAAPPPEQLAREVLPALDDGVELDLVGVFAQQGGAVVQFQPVIDGTPVDRLTRIRLDEAGNVRRILRDPLPTRRLEGAPVSADRAITAARRIVGGSRPRARLSWQVTGNLLRRVWTIELDGAPPGPIAPRVRVDARSGAVMSVDDTAEFDAAEFAPPLARVYRQHPLAEPEPSIVPLPLAALALSDDRVEVRQCRDLGEVDTWEIASGELFDFHVCTVVAADGPVDGDYLYEPVPYPADPARDEDDFAGPQVYWNVHQGLAWFDALGWTPLPTFDPRLLLTVNRRTTDYWTLETASDPTLPLLPYSNAYSTGGYLNFEDVRVPPELVFGQGETADFGYDAEVIHHELGHFVVASQNGPAWSENTSWGPSYRANTLNEVFADYFSAAIHGNPVLGEYVSEGGVRDLSGGNLCAVDLVGESHYDSLPFSQGLWAFRASLAEGDVSALDRIVLDSLAIMGKNADIPDAASVIEELVAERLGADAQAVLAALWETRGVHDCPPVIDVVPGEEPFALYALVPGSYWYSTRGEVPGTMQYRVEVPNGGMRLTLAFDQPQYLGLDLYGSNEVKPLVVVGRAGERLTWTEEEREEEQTHSGYDVTFITTEWVSDGEELATTEQVSVAPHETRPQYDMHHHVAVWDVQTPGPFVFQLANGYERSAVAYDLTLQLTPLETETELESPVAQSEPPAEEEKAGCGCTSALPAAGVGGLWVFGVAVLGRRRR